MLVGKMQSLGLYLEKAKAIFVNIQKTKMEITNGIF